MFPVLQYAGLDARQGGCPFGPAGTGKTESVKSLGGQLGRFVLVFNCDETFDVVAMSRIFIGLCQVGVSLVSLSVVCLPACLSGSLVILFACLPA